MENYFWNTEIPAKKKKLYILVIYDIVDNKRRVKFANKMSGYGFRVQKSAFEAMITENLYKKLLTEIPCLIDKNIDTVRIYKIRGSGEVKLFGVNSKIEDDNFIYTGWGNRSYFIYKLQRWINVAYL